MLGSSPPHGTASPKYMAPTYDDFSSPAGSQDRASLLRDPESGLPSSSTGMEGSVSSDQQAASLGFCGCLSVKYYQPYFDVDTVHIQARVLYALFPFRRESTFLQTLGTNPDAYGPIWIATTLVFAIAVSSNFSSWVHYVGTDTWAYDFQKVVTCAATIYGFTAVVPMLLWAALRYIKLPLPIIQTLAVYGYSLTIFIPLMALNLIPLRGFSWATCLLAAIFSSVFLLKALGPTVMDKAPQYAVPFLGAILFVQVALGLTLKLVFFSLA